HGRLVDCGPSRRPYLAVLPAGVCGGRPDEADLECFYDRNPVRPASVLLAEDEDRVVGSVAISFQRMSVGGREELVGTAVRLATDPACRGRGIFSELQRANEERVRESGVRLLLVV